MFWKMDNNQPSSMVQNLASSGILFPAYFYFMYAASPDPVTWVRIATHTAGAIVSGLIVYSTFGFIRDKKVGFRWLNSLAIAFWGFRCALHVWLGATYLLGAGRPPVWVGLVTGGSEVVFGIFYFMSRKDLTETYRGSEAMRQKVLDQIDNAVQKSAVLNWHAQLLNEKGLEVGEQIRNVGRAT